MCFTKTNSVAACGSKSSRFWAKCGKSLQVPCFFSYGFLASGQDTEMACTAPQGDPAHLLLSVPSTR
ncbi:hypothetical protein EAI89_20540 [Eubacterium sp. am_0171]|nr:hypothetical protein [Faecalicatena contorta]RYT12037.1 hypothetical protein EAI89_20540 [Eubacterium sp. am_0171]